MSKITMLSVTGLSKYDGEGSAPLIGFKHLGNTRTRTVTCEAGMNTCTVQAEMKLVKETMMAECSFIDPGNEFNNFAVNLEGILRRQERTGFENHRLFAVYIYLTDDSKSQMPRAADRGVKLKDVQILSVEKVGRQVNVAFSGLEAKTNL